MSRLLLWALASLSACSFLETAGDVEFGEALIGLSQKVGEKFVHRGPRGGVIAVGG